MTNVAYSRMEINCPLEEAYATVVDPATYPRWLVGAQKILTVDDDWPNPGSTFRHVVGAGPIKTSDITRCLALQRPAMLQLSVRARPFLSRATVRFDLQRAGGRDGAARTTVSIAESPEGRMKALAPLLVPVLRKRNDRSLQQLAEVLQTSSTGARIRT